MPPSLLSVIVTCQVGGLVQTQTLPAAPNQTAIFYFEHTNFLGRPFVPSVAHATIEFEYLPVFASVDPLVNNAFGFPGLRPSQVNARGNLNVAFRQEIPLDRVDTASVDLLAKGWLLTPQRLRAPLDPSAQAKHLQTGIISRAASDSTGQTVPDGTPLRQAGISISGYVAFDAAGTMYVSDTNAGRVYKVDRQGIVTTFAGNGQLDTPANPYFVREPTPATQAPLDHPAAIAFDRQGNAYIACRDSIRKIDAQGMHTLFAGSGRCSQDPGSPEFGDGQSALNAAICFTEGVAVDDAGNVYVADRGANFVRRIDPAGIINTLAGTGTPIASGDGGPAQRASLANPRNLCVDPAGNIYIACLDGRVRRIDSTGIITTIAGGGNDHEPNDGKSAPTLALSFPSVALDSRADLYIGHAGHILKLNVDGTVTVVAGRVPGLDPGEDDDPALGAGLFPYAFAIGPTGDFYVRDSYFRKITIPTTAASLLPPSGEVSVPEPSGNTHYFDAKSLQARTTDSTTGKTLLTFHRNAQERIDAIVDRFNNTVTLERDAAGVITGIRSPDGVRTGVTVDANGNLTSIVHPDGSHHDFEYTNSGLMTAGIKPTGDRYPHNFDDHGRLTSSEDQEGGKWTLSYTNEPNGDTVAKVTTAESSVSTLRDHTALDGRESVVETAPDGSVSTATQKNSAETTSRAACGVNGETYTGTDPRYKFSENQVQVTTLDSGLERETWTETEYSSNDPNEPLTHVRTTHAQNDRRTTLDLDLTQSNLTVSSRMGRSSTSIYDPVTLLTTRESVPGHLDSTYEYDARGRLKKSVQGDRFLSVEYGPNGQVASKTDALDRSVTFGYDSALRLSTLQQPDSRTLSFGYDPSGHLTRLTQPGGTHHDFSYNRVSLPRTYTTPGGALYQYTYDRDRRPTKTIFPSSREISFIYEAT